ncbi:MAG TPA: RNA polymerase sigma factor [Lacunisphaera sp.]|nr:RNA polymerase sigma factor [Lacunisphaera sp.]
MNPDAKQVLTEWLVISAQGGGESAFRELHGLWNADLRRFALVRVERDAAADEVVADVWLAIARGIRRLDDPACFPRWAFRIVERRSADWVRRQTSDRRRKESAALAGEVQELLSPASAAEGPSDDLQRLRIHIATLPIEQRQLVHLHYELGRSMAEIAEILGLPAGTVKSRLFTVRETLRQKLESRTHE